MEKIFVVIERTPFICGDQETILFASDDIETVEEFINHYNLTDNSNNTIDYKEVEYRQKKKEAR